MTTRKPRAFTPGQLTVHADPAALRAVTRTLRVAGRRIAFVATMGALHEGHRELIRHARLAKGASVTVVSIFVNPLQFAPGEDLQRYPRPLEADLEMCREEGVELVLTPGVEDMYPEGADTTVVPGPLGSVLEGAVRPGHFAGVLTVVAKLFHLVGPDVAYFGEKDYQQLVLVRKMARDLDFPLDVVGVPTVREPDGLALSSRNAYLSEADRPRAAALQRALRAGASVSARGPQAVLDAAREVLDAEPALDVDYLELRDPDLRPDVQQGKARLLVAARLGTTRLIDNTTIQL
ncbi:pantoate--beta-alanine ligase [Pseudonocardia sp. KRD-184]|uniref:Pantothenate synthetase n=1 Tax=Pseudonocardia oceani TaxID=2792013 RepID=A0ABS6UAG2_9PSEU|nr:pantoate--beta-alanine ligase [Pseudonocardia oceani]MBW0093738.1 pantoate--beta-alanine ligase [Pseudonocardia oceani]MBW0099778.1 pantoate--beta-alanine ligase [Pseudonocardia oceani]MBW0112457.1 pantoate--beta-alanine ligase [Pseudonocardia oceani]MBW0125609.1 pantoate--beta-alanine ligase [Pseudonocardia oceani]MBW0129226.1 pantoate--beta-alanine ligase [Pseudonocardia oceani]